MNVLFLLTLLFLTGCNLGGGGGQQPVLKDCVLPTAQSGTVQGRWKSKPIPLAIHQGDFNASEIQGIVSAIDTWNSFFNASKSAPIFDYGGDPANPRVSVATDPNQTGTLCANSVIQNTSFVGNVVIYKLGIWPSAYASSAIALTTFCTYPGSPYPYLYMSAMELNFQNFFISGKKLPDLASIVLHELGHVWGLKHSCEANPGTGMPNCSDPNLDANYSLASLYPVFGFDNLGNGQQKRTLGTNDQGRANCLY